MLRTDAVATLYLFHPLQRFSLGKQRVPILMYHSVSDSRTELVHPYYRTCTSPAVFERHLKYLHENDYSVVSVKGAVKSMEALGPAPSRRVAITFDDGYEDFHRNAFPLLSKYGFSATVYLPTAFIGDTTSRRFKDFPCLTWDQVRELHRAGIEFGSHTVTHPQLRTLKPEDVEKEVCGSKQAIEQELSCPVTSFAYPYAFPETDSAFTSRLRGFLQKAGYETGVSTIIGMADRSNDPFFMKRLPMNSCDDDRLFRAKLEGGYDWLHSVQYASKLVDKVTRR